MYDVIGLQTAFLLHKNMGFGYCGLTWVWKKIGQWFNMCLYWSFPNFVSRRKRRTKKVVRGPYKKIKKGRLAKYASLALARWVLYGYQDYGRPASFLKPNRVGSLWPTLHFDYPKISAFQNVKKINSNLEN